ncbi:polysaccharide deacetylase family protein [Undibacterium sp. Di26W]|uniref:polysaccharide deacetylase family protein n=1 Tax=Undibacterium sp. Di26W TaxID=3413035 RepID=UPI003BEFDDF3
MKTVLTMLALLVSFSFATPAQAADTFDIAITVDDLPAHGKLPPGMTRSGIAASHIKTFKAHGVPEAFGFVNAAGLANDADNAAVLDSWRQAGYPLGNHTYSHMNLDQASTLEAWQADVIAGEPAVASRMEGVFWRYLRFPYLSVGSARRDDAFAFLRDRGYKIADVSIGFSDWDYTDAYARCVGKNDVASIERIKAHYLQDVDSGIANMKENSRRVFGRVIPQVLLTHIGGWSAVTLPDVLTRLEAAGARYVTLARAQADPAYAEPGGGSLISRSAWKNNIKLVADTSGEPALDLKSICK